jgi:putative membrane protein
MRLLSLIGLAFATILGVSFALLNSTSVVVDYYIGAKKMPLSLLILIVLILGIIIGLLASLPSIIRLKLEGRRFLRDRG